MVHNGSFANHATIRRELRAAGVRFDSENDTEVGARFIAKQLADGRDVEAALKELCARRLTASTRCWCPTAIRSRWCATRSPASPPSSPRPPTGWRWAANTARWPGFPASRPPAIWEPEPEVIYAWSTMTATVTPSTCATDSAARSQRRAARTRTCPASSSSHIPTAHTTSPSASNAPVKVTVDGHVGYYAAGMNQQAEITINGNAGTGVAENMMSGTVWVKGNASQSAGATAHGGLLVIEGNAAARCGISMKGVDIVVGGDVGHMSAFMAQAGRLVIRGDAGEALGRLDLRGAHLRPRRRRVARRRLRRQGDAPRAPPGARIPAEGSRFRRRRHRCLHALRLGAHRCTTSTSTTPRATDELHHRRPRPPGPARVRHLRPADHRGHPARRRDRHLRHPRLGRQAAAAALRRPAVPRRVDVALPAGGLPRTVRHRRRARRPARQTSTAPGYPGHHRRHVASARCPARPRRRSAAAPARSARRPPPATAA